MHSDKTLNIPYARKVLEHLIAHPEEHHQGTWGVKSACGTKACIAGTTVLMNPETTVLWGMDDQMCTRVELSSGYHQDLGNRAADLLGLHYLDANRLFFEMEDAEALDNLARIIESAEKAQS